MTHEGKVVLVTGGTSGIGRATAIAFARAGATVIIAGRNVERGAAVRAELRQLGAAEFVQTDVSKFDEVQRMIASVIEQFGRLDVGVNNAGSIDAGVFQETAAFSEEDFDRHIAANLKSVWACMKGEIARMLQQPAGGAIVNVSSVNGLGGVPFNSLYAASKAGVLALTKSAALEYGTRGIRVNALVAGAFRTPMLEGVFSRIAPDDPASVAESYGKMVALQRIGSPEEAAAAIVWLSSEAASYVTGHSMIVDGGLTAPYR